MNKVRAHTNIALIKYWGKADALLRLPLMSSLSMTLDAFYTETSIEATDGPDQFYLNGSLQDDQTAKRVFKYLNLLKQNYGKIDNLLVKSDNHVPTAAGLASSSSAFAAMAAAFDSYYQLNLSKRDLSIWARQGSGSASRSIFGGFSIWQKGHDSASSYAYPIDENPQMDLHLLAIELNVKKKKLSSTQGMLQAKSSPFFQTWLNRNEQEISQMQDAISNNDFTKLGELAELNANEMHAINLSAQPGFTYFEPNTLKAINIVHELRSEGIECYYTLDAGPNLKILCQLRNVKFIKNRFESVFDNVNIIDASFGPGITYLD